MFWCNISNKRKNVSSDIQTLRKLMSWKNEAQTSFLQPTSKCLDIYCNTLWSVWHTLLKALIIVREIQSKSSQNFMIIAKRNITKNRFVSVRSHETPRTESDKHCDQNKAMGLFQQLIKCQIPHSNKPLAGKLSRLSLTTTRNYSICFVLLFFINVVDFSEILS